MNHTISNLPAQRTTFIGRQTEVQELVALLKNQGAALVTLTGAGGTGKTRLAMQVGAALLPHFKDGVYFVPLDSLTCGEQVIPAVAQVLGVIESGQQPVFEDLRSFLAEKHLLLILDNFEHVARAAGQVSDLLAASPGLNVQVTSREALHLYHERLYPVEPLALPEPAAVASARPEAIAHYSSVALFAERASAVLPGFTLDKTSAAAVAEICVLLDGLPLAIELAAARLKLFTPPALLYRLRDGQYSGLKLLSGDMCDRPDRQKTLRAAIAWSYDLLNPLEQAIFRRVGAFFGSFSDLAAEAVAEVDDVLDLLESLVDQSLLRVQPDANGEPRFRMLHVVREFALEQLAVQGEREHTQQRHAAYYLAFAGQADNELRGKDQERWLALLEDEHENLRAALRWAEQLGQVESGLRMVGALGHFWLTRGHLQEGSAWAAKFLSLSSSPSFNGPVLRAKALVTASRMAWGRGDIDAAYGYQEENLSIWQMVGDPQGIAKALNNMGFIASTMDDLRSAESYHEESLQIVRELGDLQGIADSLYYLGMVAFFNGAYRKARALHEESLKTRRDLNDQSGIAFSTIHLAHIALEEGDLVTSQMLYEEALQLWQRQGNPLEVAFSLEGLGKIHLALNEFQPARAKFEEVMAVRRKHGDQLGLAYALQLIGVTHYLEGELASGLAWFEESLATHKNSSDKTVMAQSLECLARLAAAGGLAEQAAVLWGAAEALREAFLIPLPPSQQALNQKSRAEAQAAVHAQTWQVRWEEGRALPIEGRLAYMMHTARSLRQVLKNKQQSRGLALLSNREREVLHLVAQGLSDAQVAEHLFLSVRTINAHLTSIYNKLGVNSRTAAARYALENGLT